MKAFRMTLTTIGGWFAGEAARRADRALAVAARQREQRRTALETSRSSNALMNDALRKLHDALRRTAT